ncbi:MAG: nucleotide pyrophosphatase [Candidatus Aminicenantes bacterium RBG_19FT_COMBO_58_17]|nr:MAG: nucleotide pyrophosphatase [Candidatus Aminicenantes bacterium RBG_19FT_COMBO_58_17]
MSKALVLTRSILIGIGLVLLSGLPTFAYIGPGAGFAFLSSFLVLFLTFFLAVLSFLSWPFRLLIRVIKGRKAIKGALVDRVVIVGLDGLEPTLAEKFMAEGKLPHLSQLKNDGTYARLQTTTPAISPVAWSSFMTGSEPSKHNIFDFLSRDPKTYLPSLSSAYIGRPKRALSLGKYTVPLSKPEIRGMRKSVPFWKTLGEAGIFSTVLRVPITFPPEKFSGHLLSGMCAPDLKGSQGTFTFYTTDQVKHKKREGGVVIPVEVRDGCVRTYISGPENSLLKKAEEIKIPLQVEIDKQKQEAQIEFSGQRFRLKVGEFSPWIKIAFKPGLRMKFKAIARFLVSEVEPDFEMYLTPLNIDPEKPALPISHPFIYSVYLSKLLGSFITLGEANDTWALNEGALSEAAFLELTYSNHREWEGMFFNALSKTKKGMVVCVFETTDSIQHMFWRYLDKAHPALRTAPSEQTPQVIEDLYTKMDDLIGRVRANLDSRTALIVMSDHGFKSFRRGVNLNSWLFLNGYLRLKEAKETSDEWFKDVDWGKTKAFALGLGGMYINQKGREANGIVAAGEETRTLKEELRLKLTGLRDEAAADIAITEVYDRDKVYSGPYAGNAPDLIIGYNQGFRASWDSVTGKVNSTVFEDNTKAWSGDHCIDPQHVPGVFFFSHKIGVKSPSIMDVAPTVLTLFGLPVPGHMDGRPLISPGEPAALPKKKGKKK